MFLTRACEIINKEGFRTFVYALGQKVRERMTEQSAYQSYIKKVEPKQRIGQNDICVEPVRITDGSKVMDILEAVGKVSCEYAAIYADNIELSEDFFKTVSGYVYIQKKSGNQKEYIYCDSDVITQDRVREKPDCKPDYSWDTLLSFNYIGDAFIIRKDFFIKKLKQYINTFDKEDIFDCYKISMFLLAEGSLENVGHIHQILFHKKSTDIGHDAVTDDIENYKRKLLNTAGVNADVIRDSKQEKVNHIHYMLNNHKMVSIIIPSKDNPDILKCCVESIYKYTWKTPYEIIIVDNGSGDNNRRIYQDMADASQGKILYIYEKFDFNFSKMCNIGARAAKGKQLLFLNDDIEIIKQEYSDTDWLGVLAGQAAQPGTGAVGVKLLYPQTSYIQHIGVINYETSCFAHLYAKAADDSNIKAFRNVADYNCLCVTGACLMLGREKFDNIGGFDEKLTVTHNDVDLCLSLYEKGYMNVLRNDVCLYHHESFSRGDDEIDEEKNKRNMRARDLTYMKHPALEKYDPFYSPLLTQEDNDYRFAKEINSVVYKTPVRISRPVIKDKDKIIDTVKVTQIGYHDNLSIRGFAYKGNKVYYNPVILLYNNDSCYRIKSKSLCDRVFNLRKNIEKNINYAPFYCGVDIAHMGKGTYKCAIKIEDSYYDTGCFIHVQ